MVCGGPQHFPGSTIPEFDLDPSVGGLYGGLVREHEGSPGELLRLLIPVVSVVPGRFAVLAGAVHTSNLIVVPQDHLLKGNVSKKFLQQNHIYGLKMIRKIFLLSFLGEVEVVTGRGLIEVSNAVHLYKYVEFNKTKLISLVVTL